MDGEIGIFMSKKRKKGRKEIEKEKVWREDEKSERKGNIGIEKMREGGKNLGLNEIGGKKKIIERMCKSGKVGEKSKKCGGKGCLKRGEEERKSGVIEEEKNGGEKNMEGEGKREEYEDIIKVNGVIWLRRNKR